MLYSGDILQVLALAGFYLVMISKLSQKWLMCLSAFFLLQVPMIIQIYCNAVSTEQLLQPHFFNLMGQARQVIIDGDFYDMLVTNVWQNQLGKWVFFYESGRIWSILGLFTAGLYIERTCFFENTTPHQKEMVKVTIGAIILLLLTIFINYLASGYTFVGILQWQVSQLILNYQNLSLMALGIIIFIYCYQLDVFTKFLRLLVPCGRMSLTVYICQSIICIPIFYPFGLGLYQSIGQPLSVLLGIILWIFIVISSHFWMKNYAFGPFEWLWRKVTYIGFSNAITLKNK